MRLFLSAISALFLSYTYLYANTYSGNDLSRILYHKDDPSSFLILRKITADGKLFCSHYGKKKIFTVAASDVRKTFFFEQSSSFVISQYLLYYHAHGINSEYIHALANKSGRSTHRMQIFNQYMQNKKIFLNNFNKAIKRSSVISDPDDRLDMLHNVLDNCHLEDIVLNAVDSEDWLLAVTLLKDHHDLMKYVASMDVKRRSLYNDAMSKTADLEEEVVSSFNNYLQEPSPLQQRFKALYPQSSGLWSTRPPIRIKQLYALQLDCLKAYLNLDRLSSAAVPEKWGNAMLDSLLMIEKSPAAEELRQEFITEIALMENIQKTNKSSTDKPINTTSEK